MDIGYVDISDKAALFSSELAYCYEYEEAHDFGYMACYPHEELDNEALRAAILEVELSNQYSFYDFAINEADKKFIASLNITSFSNEVFLWSEVE